MEDILISGLLMLVFAANACPSSHGAANGPPANGTSMMLRIQPYPLVDFAATMDVKWGRAFAPANRAWVTLDRSPQGHVGCPQIASAEKGETVFRVFAARVVALLERVIAWDGKEWDA